MFNRHCVAKNIEEEETDQSADVPNMAESVWF